MGRLSEHTDIDAPALQVWTVLADVTLLPELSESTVDVVVDGPLQRKGQTFEQTVRLAGRNWTSTWCVEDISPPDCLVITGSLPGGTPYRLTERLDRVGDDRTRLEIQAEYELPMGALGRLASRLGVERRARQELREVLRGVASACEHRPDRRSAS